MTRIDEKALEAALASFWRSRKQTDERIAVAIRAYLSALEPTRPSLAKVKALEWNVDGFAHTDQGIVYRVMREPGYWKLEKHEGSSVFNSAHPSEEAAKTAAQTDYERRVLSALEPAPAGAEGWRPMESPPKNGARVLLWPRERGFPVFGSYSDYTIGGPSWRADSGALLFPEAWMPSPPAPAGKE